MIPFNKPTVTGMEEQYISEAIKQGELCGDGSFTHKCNEWFEQHFDAEKALLTTSCTHALEMAAILIDIQPGDEVIMPSYTFVSTANAFVLRGAKVVFIDVDPKTMNMNPILIEEAITKKTRAIVPVHYAGVACNMNEIMSIASKHNLYVIEDAAQGVMSKYNGRYLGTIGHLGCYSFHETKNYNCGEGGALVINDPQFIEKAEIIREKGTDRSRFFRGQVDKYTWVNQGSSYLPSELNAAFLFAQLENAEFINEQRLKKYEYYYKHLSDLAKKGYIQLPFVPEQCEHNAHMFYIKVKDLDTRSRLIQFMKQEGVISVFHYVPLHSAKAGQIHGVFYGEDRFTTKESERLMRLPLYHALTESEMDQVIDLIKHFFE